MDEFIEEYGALIAAAVGAIALFALLVAMFTGDGAFATFIRKFIVSTVQG